MSGVFVSWTLDNGRTRQLAERLGLDPHFVHHPGRFGILGRYVRQHVETRRLLRAAQPKRAVLMLPPAVALPSFLAALPDETPIAFDLHTGFFLNPKWRWAARATLRAIQKRGGTAIVTNEHLRAICARQGVEAVVLHDVITPQLPLPTEDHLLCPLSYANDEPITALLQAAEQTPKLRWCLTGRAPARIRALAPSNVTFTGYLEPDEYDRLLRSSLGVIALTTRPHTMQRAGYEAFNAGVPQVTSDFAELREFYQDSAVYATSEPGSIAAAARTLLRERDQIALRLPLVRAERVVEQQHALQQLRMLLQLPLAEAHAPEKEGHH